MHLAIGPQDMGRKRNFDHGDFKFVFEASDPYGFVSGYCLKTKEHLNGTFTDFRAAEVAAMKYANDRKPAKGGEGGGSIGQKVN